MMSGATAEAADADLQTVWEWQHMLYIVAIVGVRATA